MYEIIMDLPLFKGVSRSLVSSFLERTHLGFDNYSAGERIITEGEDYPGVGFLIKGNVRTVFTSEKKNLKVSESSGSGRVFGADKLFGINRNLSSSVYALNDVSVMSFSKDQYVKLLYTDSIYMLNFFNYLSLRSQKAVDVVMKFSGYGIKGYLASLVYLMTESDSKDIEVEISASSLGELSSAERYEEEL